MKFIADFHIHSPYSIATSKKITPEYIDYWARVKGINIVGTGDFTHPSWLKELKEKIEPTGDGLYKLKDSLKNKNINPNQITKFILTSEISNIYKKRGKVRKVHNLIFVPDFKTVEKIQYKLSQIGNITSDGRPILGLDSRDLLEIVLDSSDEAYLVPAHIWTPWFSVLGSKSGFNDLQECYEDLTPNIFAVETGLSSDPPMNWLCSFLDKYTLISNSDAHSLEKLGREANIFNTDLSYSAIKKTMETGDKKKFLGTIEFFPQEGKYHYDGHRKCNIRWDPLETDKHNGICPKCGKKVTIGVMNRVAQLADKDYHDKPENKTPFNSLIPLKEILSQILGTGENSQKVKKVYFNLIKKFKNEFNLLLNISRNDIEINHNEILAEAIYRMRQRKVKIQEGYDGEFGKIEVFSKDEIKTFQKQSSLFSEFVKQKKKNYITKKKLINFNITEFQKRKEKKAEPELFNFTNQQKLKKNIKTDIFEGLNEEQKIAVQHFKGPALVIAGPGTGKTRVLTQRIAYLINKKKIKPENILAVTFTNKAAEEMKNRLEQILTKDEIKLLTISTFHALGLSILRECHRLIPLKENFSIFTEKDKLQLISNKFNLTKKEISDIYDKISGIKQNLRDIRKLNNKKLIKIFQDYELALKIHNSLDIDDLIYKTIHILQNKKNILKKFKNKYQWILIDEYQDINNAQDELVNLLASPEHLFVIGDPNQSIYGFRGANLECIQNFKNNHPQTKIFKLKKSYRCPETILTASDQVISGKLRNGKQYLEGINKGVKIIILQNKTEKAEAERIARTIEYLMGGVRFFSIDSNVSTGERNKQIGGFSDFTVLARLTKMLKPLEKAFMDHSIPYQKIGEKPFFKREPIKNIIDVLKIIINPQNTFFINELINKKVISIKDIQDIKDHISTKSIKDILHIIILTCFNKESKNKEELINKLLNLAANYGDNIDDFLKFISLGTPIDDYNKKTENVKLMTLHAAKGLEFNCVFIIGCEDGILPYNILDNYKANIKEERRLLYVGMTRAKRFLYLSYARKRFLYGHKYSLNKSPFIIDIEKELTYLSESDYKKKPKRKGIQKSLFD